MAHQGHLIPHLAWLLWLLTLPALATPKLDFTLHRLDSGVEGPTVLIFGGIQGDEPGGFHAASLLVTDYNVTRGQVWVVPNLNFTSIVQRSRGVYGDMNRKFAQLPEDDPDYPVIERVKELIRDERVDFILNLHDGSGFYHPDYKSSEHNPHRWGQSVIIDQATLEGARYGQLEALSKQVAGRVNSALIKEGHRYHVRNTRTREGDREMAKTLTYFAINQGKAAAGVEASKSLPTHERVYYHLQVVEGFLAGLGVGYTRPFQLQPQQVQARVDNDIYLSLKQNRLRLDLSNARNRIGYVPLQRGATLEFDADNPLVAVTSKGGLYQVNYGNRRMTDIHPQYFDYDFSLRRLEMVVDGSKKAVTPGTVVEVRQRFEVVPQEGYRVNVIGWTRPGISDESGREVVRGSIPARFSLDRDATLYRVEVYREERFCALVLVRFVEERQRVYSQTEVPRFADSPS